MRSTVADPAPATVIIDGSRTDTQARREFVAGKIVIGRQRIEESGVNSVQEHGRGR